MIMKDQAWTDGEMIPEGWMFQLRDRLTRTLFGGSDKDWLQSAAWEREVFYDQADRVLGVFTVNDRDIAPTVFIRESAGKNDAD